jgi:hypothetical protein
MTKALATQCVAKTRQGNRCKQKAIIGGTVCRYHGGATKKVKAKAAVRAELMNWNLTDETADPGETLLRLLTQSRARVELYSMLLQDAYEAGEKLKELYAAKEIVVAPVNDDPPDDGEDVVSPNAAIVQAQMELDRIFNSGGVAALVGYKYGGAGKEGHIYAASEAIRGLAVLEGEERDRCATFAAKAISAGLKEREVRLAERQVELFARALRAVLDDLDLTPEQKRREREVVTRQIELLAGVS